jgi:hypothetical protein
MAKRVDKYEVISCTGYISADSSQESRCPFYSDEYGYCTILEINLSDSEDGYSIPSDCDLRKSDIVVSMKEN